jgi:hypothetical protein
MVLLRGLIVSWFVVLSLVVLIGAQILPATTSDFTARNTAEMEERSAYDEVLAGVERIRNDKTARKMVPLVTISSQQVSHFGLSPSPTGRTVTAFTRGHALRVHQLISVYRI